MNKKVSVDIASMDPKNMTALIVGSVVCVVVFSALLIPIVSEATTTEKTFINEGVFDYGIFTPEDTYTIEFDNTTGKLTINDVEIDPIIASNKTGSYSVVASDNVLLRYGHTTTYYYLQCVGINSSNSTVSADVISATIDNGQLVVTKDETTDYTFDFTELYAIVTNEDVAIMKQATGSVYINGDSQLYASGLTTITNWNNMFHFEGTYDDGITISSANTDATYSNITWNIEPVTGYIDLYELTSIEFDINYNDTVTHAVYSYFGVPERVTAELTVHPDAATLALLSVLPIIAMIGIILAVVGAFVVSRNDY